MPGAAHAGAATPRATSSERPLRSRSPGRAMGAHESRAAGAHTRHQVFALHPHPSLDGPQWSSSDFGICARSTCGSTVPPRHRPAPNPLTGMPAGHRFSARYRYAHPCDTAVSPPRHTRRTRRSSLCPAGQTRPEWSANEGFSASRRALTQVDGFVTVQGTRWVRWLRRLGDSGWDAHFRPAMDDTSTIPGSNCHRFLGRRTLSSWLAQ